jgi:hypothetical protein
VLLIKPVGTVAGQVNIIKHALLAEWEEGFKR